MDSRAEQPDIYIIDRHIPTIDGLALLKYLKVQKRSKAVPVILISSTNIEERAIEAGANAFVAKPFALKDIIHYVEKLTGHNINAYH